MNETQKQFAEQLLAVDRPSPDERSRYEREIRNMMAKTLSPRERGFYLLGAVFLLLVAAFFGMTAGFATGLKADFFPYVMAYFILTSIVSALAAWLMWRSYWSGKIDRSGSSIVGIGVVYAGLLGWIFLLMARYTPEPLQNDVRFLGLVILVYAAVAWIRHRIDRAERLSREKMLEIELRLVDIHDSLKAISTRPETQGS